MREINDHEIALPESSKTKIGCMRLDAAKRAH
jgi:hypothetical protein